MQCSELVVACALTWRYLAPRPSEGWPVPGLPSDCVSQRGATAVSKQAQAVLALCPAAAYLRICDDGSITKL